MNQGAWSTVVQRNQQHPNQRTTVPASRVSNSLCDSMRATASRATAPSVTIQLGWSISIRRAKWSLQLAISCRVGRSSLPDSLRGLQRTAFVMSTSYRLKPATASNSSKVWPVRSRERGTSEASAPDRPGASTTNSTRAGSGPMLGLSTRLRPSIRGQRWHAWAAWINMENAPGDSSKGSASCNGG